MYKRQADDGVDDGGAVVALNVDDKDGHGQMQQKLYQLLWLVDAAVSYTHLRLYVTPGLSCYWQIAPHRSQLSFDEWMALDVKMIFQSTRKLRSLTYFTSSAIHSSKLSWLRCGAICQ